MGYALMLVSIAIQVALAVHAYNRGRVSPWIWIILFFPLVGSIVYAVIFIVPELSLQRRPRRRARPRSLREVPQGPYAAVGNRPENAIAVESAAVVESRAACEDCPSCGATLHVAEHRAERIDDRLLRIVVLQCRRCGTRPVRYFEVRPGKAPPNDDAPDQMH